ncbi:cytochrome b-245 chaperone 1 isoform X1 [Serinus canaria]|uniref:cytochrome b-245 chaperone 1 isoform X1 n=1 Tax=Serinus canaria TaxID=9135 RepID=UPI0008DB5BF5|nr:cytochrome b-245 chaperone 1 isoform X1 [Serinus canaria]
MYMLVEKRTNSCLHLKRSPGIRSWSLCVGIASIGLAAAYYSADSLAWKLFYMAGCFFVAAQNLEQWEEAVFDKNKGTICLKTFNLYKKILTLSKGGNEQVVAVLSEIRDVNVEEEAVRYFGKGYLVVLRFVTGFSHPLTQSAVLGCRRCSGDLGKLERVSDVEAVAKLITSFLELDRVETPQDFSQSSETEASDADEPQVKY